MSLEALVKVLFTHIGARKKAKQNRNDGLKYFSNRLPVVSSSSYMSYGKVRVNKDNGYNATSTNQTASTPEKHI